MADGRNPKRHGMELNDPLYLRMEVLKLAASMAPPHAEAELLVIFAAKLEAFILNGSAKTI